MIGPFRPFAELQRGRGGVVYRALDPAAGDAVLLKVFADAGPDAAPPAEAALLEGVTHPNLVPVRRAGVDDGRPYVAFDYLEGGDLSELLDDGPLPPEMALFVLRETARALKAAHAHGVLHRDVKPSNILVPEAGGVLLTDFGLATMRGDGGGVRGTPGYLAPEVVRGAPHTPASDVFALGVCLYEMCTGRRAFGARAPVDAALHRDLAEAFPEQPAALRSLAAGLLAREPQQRLATADAVLRALDDAADDDGAVASPEEWARFRADPRAWQRRSHAPRATPPSVPEAPPRARAARRRAWTGLVAGVALLALAAAGAWLAVPPTEPDVRTETAALEPSLSDAAAAASDAAPTVVAPTDVADPSPDADPTAGTPADGTPVGGRPAGDAPAPGSTPGALAPPPAGGASEPAAHVDVRVRPWASVWVDGDSVGTTPLGAPLALAPGAHTIVLRHPDFPERSETVRLAGGEAATLDVSLWDGVGRVHLDVSPWAHVEIDGRRVGTTPLVRPLLLAPGLYALRLVHPSLGTWTVPLVVRAGEEQRLALDFPTREIREGT